MHVQLLISAPCYKQLNTAERIVTPLHCELLVPHIAVPSVECAIGAKYCCANCRVRCW
jgi:hypothetical protein